MSTSFYKSWWREMGAISRGMMFIEGNIATPAVLEPERASPELPVEAGPPPIAAAARLAFQDKVLWLLEDLLLLGGRPVTLPHNDDINEPLPRLHRRHRTRFAAELRKADIACS